MESINFEKIDDLKSKIGSELAVSDWVDITQEMIDQFGATTGDNNWIYTDVPRATRESPYGGTIAQGFLALCFLTKFAKEIVAMNNHGVCISYGLNRVRFPAPVRTGQRIRAHLELLSFNKLAGGGTITWKGTVGIDGWAKPACDAEIICQCFNIQRAETVAHQSRLIRAENSNDQPK